MDEIKIYESQERYIREKFGKEASQNANYGWFVDGSVEGVTIHTKVYGHGTLTSFESNNKIEHRFEEGEKLWQAN